MHNGQEIIYNLLEFPYILLANNKTVRDLRALGYIKKNQQWNPSGKKVPCMIAILISITETCRNRQQSIWLYLATVIHYYQSGLPIPKLPSPVSAHQSEIRGHTKARSILGIFGARGSVFIGSCEGRTSIMNRAR